jgi:hypothetical protein
MPKNFPGPPDDKGDPTAIKYWTVSEAAPILNVSRQRLREMCATQKWPCLPWFGKYYVSAADMARIVEMRIVDVDAIPEGGTELGCVERPWDDEEGVQ